MLTLNSCFLTVTTFIVITSTIRHSAKMLMTVCLFRSLCWPDRKNAESVKNTPIVFLECQSQARYNFMDELSKKESKAVLVAYLVKDSILSRQSADRRRQGCQPYAPAALTPQKHYLLFLVLISVRG
jgi:hypothetical protein